MQGCAAATHRIKDDLAFQTARCVEILLALVENEMLQQRREMFTTPSCPPLVQIGVGPIEMLVVQFLLRQLIGELCIEFRSRSVNVHWLAVQFVTPVGRVCPESA